MSLEEVEANKLRERAAEVIADDLSIDDWRMRLTPWWELTARQRRLWIGLYRVGVDA